jgi:WhiB family redox-sensing transcriptional regulator
MRQEEVEALMLPGDELPLLAELLLRPAWTREAACREHPTATFFPGSSETQEPALAVCRTCLVQKECLAYAHEHFAQGVWGGTSERERKRMRAGRAA